MFALKQWLHFTLSPFISHCFKHCFGRWHLSVVCALLLSCTTWTVAKAGVALFDSDIQLRGAQASYAVPVLVSGSQPQALQLRLQWAVSGLVDPNRSIVNVLVNGQIRSTRRLSDIGNAGWQLNLRPLKAGQQELRVQVYLRAKGEDCIPMPESLWLTLLPTSRIAGASPLSQATSSSLAVKDFPKAWHSSASEKAQPGGKHGKSLVEVSIEHPWDASAAAAYTQAQVYLAQQGLASPKSVMVSSEAGQLILRSLERLEPKHPARDRWALAADTRFVIYAAGAHRLEIITKDTQHISSAIELLANDALRALCHESLCSSSLADATQTHSAKAVQSTQAQDLLWSMAQGDQPRGWTARGAGAHTLRQVWVRPHAVDFQSDVNLLLAARASQAAQLDALQSSISLRINDQPIATYSLQDWKVEHASVRIPESLWRAAVWVMDFEVRLTPRPQQRCSYLAQEDLWLSLDPATRLNAKFEHRETAGIAGFWQRAGDKSTLHLAWSESSSALPTREQLALFIPVLQTFSSRAKDAITPRWTFVDRTACKSTTCIVLHPPVSSAATQERLLLWREAFGTLPQQAQRIPDLNVAGTAVIAWTPKDGKKAEQLHLVLGAPKHSPIAVPQMNSFNGPIAVHTDQWQFFATADDIVNTSTTNKGAGNVSQQQGRLRWVNLIWAIVSLVIVATLAMLYWRKKKKADPKTWEVS